MACGGRVASVNENLAKPALPDIEVAWRCSARYNSPSLPLPAADHALRRHACQHALLIVCHASCPCLLLLTHSRGATSNRPGTRKIAYPQTRAFVPGYKCQRTSRVGFGLGGPGQSVCQQKMPQGDLQGCMECKHVFAASATPEHRDIAHQADPPPWQRQSLDEGASWQAGFLSIPYLSCVNY
eukprot:14133-Pelagomonas_calceolata.AAC.2